MHDVYFTDRGIEELDQRRGDDEVTLAWVETPVERLATWLARLDDEDD
jgi:hypothetical protein